MSTDPLTTLLEHEPGSPELIAGLETLAVHSNPVFRPILEHLALMHRHHQERLPRQIPDAVQAVQRLFHGAFLCLFINGAVKPPVFSWWI